MLRIGVTQRVEIVADRDERRDCLDQAWTSLLIENECWPIAIPNRVEHVKSLLTDLALDGVILTGGNDPAHLPGAQTAAPERDALERRLLDACSAGGVPVLGVCRGMQMLLHYHGGGVVPVAGHVGIRHRLIVHRPGDIPLTDRDAVNSFHAFGCYAGNCGSDWQVIATAPDDTVEAVAHRRLPQWGIMWHPERNPPDGGDGVLLRALFEGGRI